MNVFVDLGQSRESPVDSPTTSFPPRSLRIHRSTHGITVASRHCRWTILQGTAEPQPITRLSPHPFPTYPLHLFSGHLRQHRRLPMVPFRSCRPRICRIGGRWRSDQRSAGRCCRPGEGREEMGGGVNDQVVE